MRNIVGEERGLRGGWNRLFKKAGKVASQSAIELTSEALHKRAAPKSGSTGPVFAPNYPINLRRSTPATPRMPEANSMMLLGSGVVSRVPLNVKASEGIEPRVFS